MAQHIPIKGFKQKKFRDIENGIRKAFASERYEIPFRTSMKYIYDENISQHARLNDDELVYMTQYRIPKGIVINDETGDFEIHYNKKTKEIDEIYLVA